MLFLVVTFLTRFPEGLLKFNFVGFASKSSVMEWVGVGLDGVKFIIPSDAVDGPESCGVQVLYVFGRPKISSL